MTLEAVRLAEMLRVIEAGAFDHRLHDYTMCAITGAQLRSKSIGREANY